MSARGLIPQQVHIPFGVGLNQKMDPRALQVPSLARCLDAAFTEYGGLQTRYPYATIGANIFGGGTLSDCRRIVENGNELLCFTKTALYSWNAQLSVWVLKGTHLAVKLEESSKFVTTGDQVGCDRCQLLGTVFYSWHETVGSVSTAYVAAVDASTGAVLLAPYTLGGASRVRLTALSTKVLLSFYDGIGGIYGYMLDPASPATALAGSSTTLSSAAVSTSAGPYYDVVKIPLADQAVYVVSAATATAYTIGTITAGLVVARSSKARNSVSSIAVSCEPTGASAQVVRADAGAIRGDLITISTLADVYTAQAVGTYSTTINQIAAAHRSTQDSAVYRCYAFWSSGETTGSANWESRSNWVSTGNTLGTEAVFVRKLGVASRAFDHDGRVYVWTVFAGASTFPGPAFGAQLQNTYFLYRDDAFLCAKSTMHRAAGFATLAGCLPGVQSTATGVYSWCGGERRVISLGANQSGYAARAPRDITLTFDSNEARRVARLGPTMYISGGEVLQYDGVNLTEVGFHIYPWDFAITSSGTTGLATGTYAYRMTWRWDNAHGEVDRSTTAAIGTVDITAGPKGAVIGSASPLYTTHKTADPIAYEIWRTAVNPTLDAPYYLSSDKDPGQIGAAANEYVENDIAADNLPTFGDLFADSTLTSKESSAENGGLLEPLAPPAASIIHATADRIFLAGVAGDPHRIWYSRQRQEGEVASFHDALTVDVPRAGGDITAISVRDGVLYVWRETACYALPGDGFDNLGGGQNFGPSRLLSSDVGCVSMEALAQTSTGFVFKSSKGWYALSGAQLEYIGDKVSSYDSETVHAVHVLEGQHEIRVLTSGRMLVLNTNVNQWGEWTISDGVHATLWNGTYHYLSSTGARAEQATYTGVTYGMDIETAWIPLGQIQGYGRLWEVKVLGETRSANYLQVRLYRNWNSTTAFQTKNWALSPTTVGGPMQVEHRPSIQEMQAVKIRLTAIRIVAEDPGVAYAPLADVFKLTHLSLEIGLERHLARLPLAQTQ